jgi:hypothetical protein
MKRILSGVVTYIVLTVVMGFVWNMALFHGAYAGIGGPGRREHPIMPLGVSSIIIESAALSLLFSRFCEGQGRIQEGITLTMLVGAFSVGYAALVVPAKFSVTPVWQYIALESIVGILHFGSAGILFSDIFKP